MSDESVANELPLAGIRIIDFGQIAMVPIGTSFLADFGAEVIKVESFARLEPGRRDATMSVDGDISPDRSLLYARYNQNKLGALLNLKHPKGVALAKKLVSLADVVIENFTVGVMPRLGLGYDDFRKVKKDIIMISGSFGGQTGPYKDFRAQGFVLAALQGIDDLTGWPDRGPCSPASAFGDHYIPFMYAIQIMAALEYRRQTGNGQFIDGSSFEGCLDALDTAITDYSVNGRVLKRRGNRHPAAAPHGVYRCQGEERWCAIAVFSDEEWQSFCRVLGSPAWAAEARFSTLLKRLENVDALEQLIEAWTREHKVEDVALALQQAGIAATVVNNIKDLHEDPQLIHRQHFWEPEEPGMEPYTFEAPSARLSQTPARLQRRHPLLGEHNDYVYGELLGIDPQEYAQLVEEKVIF
ncbi:MAG: CoA transferase [Dehalococcoidales bacterium]|nr:CoA transferase [Dehalococcoidales bacterium]